MFSVYTFGVFYLVKRGVLIFVGEIIMLEKWPLLISLSTSLKGRPKYIFKKSSPGLVDSAGQTCVFCFVFVLFFLSRQVNIDCTISAF